MTMTLVVITARQLLGRRRGLLLLLLAAAPVAIALLYRLTTDEAEGGSDTEWATGLIQNMVVLLVLPLVALVLGTAALGAEIEDGTAVYLLATPVERWRIVLVKVVTAAAATAVIVAPTTLATALIIFRGVDEHGVAVGFAAAVVVGALAYCSLFVALSAVTSRALIAGLGYVFVWEAVVTGIFSGTRWVSIREYTLGIADLISSAPEFSADIAGARAPIGAALVIVVCYVLGVRFLSRFEIGERS